MKRIFKKTNGQHFSPLSDSAMPETLKKQYQAEHILIDPTVMCKSGNQRMNSAPILCRDLLPNVTVNIFQIYYYAEALTECICCSLWVMLMHSSDTKIKWLPRLFAHKLMAICQTNAMSCSLSSLMYVNFLCVKPLIRSPLRQLQHKRT